MKQLQVLEARGLKTTLLVSVKASPRGRKTCRLECSRKRLSCIFLEGD